MFMSELNIPNVVGLQNYFHVKPERRLAKSDDIML